MVRWIKFFADTKLHLYSMLLLVATFMWMALPYNDGLDMTIQKWVQLFKIGVSEQKPPSKQVIFIDVSKSRYLLPLNSDSTENDVIVNRRYLIQLFSTISAHHNQVKYVLTDVLFDATTPDDSALRKEIVKLGPKFLAVDSYSAKDSLERNLLGVRAGTATVRLQSGSVYKIPFKGKFGDTLVSAKFFLDQQKTAMRSNFLFTWFTGKGLSFNSQINDLYLRAKDFDNGEYVKIGLGELVSLLKLSPAVFKQYLQDRYILIGDFENDVHGTYLNSQPGTLILFDAFWHLKENRQLLSFGYLLILYLFLYVTVWLQTTKWSLTHQIKLKIKKFQAFLIPVNIITVSILLVAFTAVSAVMFGVNISVFHLIGIFSALDLILFFRNKLEKQPDDHHSNDSQIDR